MIFILIFVFSFLLLFWYYFGYLLFLKFLLLVTRNKRKKAPPLFKKDSPPFVTILIPTYNEEKHILEKIKNTLEIDYPTDKKEIVIIDSASQDGTVKNVKALIQGEKNVKLLQETSRRGKGAALNYAISETQGEIILVTDANSFLNCETLKRIIPHFCSEDVGGVCGKFQVLETGKSLDFENRTYWAFEEKLRSLESELDSVIHMSGEISAFRKGLALYDENDLAEDFELAVQIRKKGFLLVYEPKAVANEEIPYKPEEFVKRKKDVTIGTIQTLWKHRDAIFNPKYGWYGMLILPSHKLLQIFLPWLSVLTVVSFQLGLILNLSSQILKYFLAGESLIFVIVLLILGLPFGKRFSLTKRVRFYLLAQWIIIGAWKDFFRGRFEVTWQKAGR